MIIDTCYEGVIAKLTSQGKINEISQKLLSLKNNNDRVLYVYSLFEELNAFPSVQKVTKSENVSVCYRNLGNKCFEKTQYHKAWQYYNISLLNAPVKSESYCLALSNRSAVFFELEKYNECVQDINLVMSLEYPQRLTEKLTNRKKSCEEALLNQKKSDCNENDLNDLIKMKGSRDSRYSCASEKLEVVYSKEMGRHVIAKEDVSVGEVLVEEDPYFTLLLKSQFLFSCSYCLSRSLNLTPCDNCCFSLYCSEECKAKALKEYHAIECSLMATLIEMDFTKLELLALRTVIKARNDHSDWASLYQTIEDAEANINTELHGHVKVDDKWIYDSKYYASIHTLTTNVEKRSVSDIFQKSVTAVVFLRFLLCNTNFLADDSKKLDDKVFSCVAGLLLLHLMTTPTNMHGLSTNQENKDGKCDEEISIASAPYAFFSLINHSCAPNVVRFSKLGAGKMSLFVLRPIKKGMQLFDNYGSHHALESCMERRYNLKFQYKFSCLCEACVNNWPTYLNMRPSKKIPKKLIIKKSKVLSPQTIDKLQEGNLKTARIVFPDLCRLCEELEPFVPCMELCDCQEALKQCLVIFEGIVPYGCTQTVEWKPILSSSGTKSSSKC